MANEGVEALGALLATYQNGGNVTQTVNTAVEAAQNQTPQTVLNASLAAAQLIDSAVSSIGRNPPVLISTANGEIPVAGIAISAASALNNAAQVIVAIPSGKIPKAEAYGALSDAYGAIGGVALGIAAVAGGTAGSIALLATIGGALTIASVGLAITRREYEVLPFAKGKRQDLTPVIFFVAEKQHYLTAGA